MSSTHGINAIHKSDLENAASRKMTYSKVIFKINVYMK